MIKGILIPAFVLNEDKEIIRRRDIKNGGKQSKYYEKYVEMQQLRQYCGGNQATGDLSFLQTEMRIYERDLLSTRLRLYGDG